MNESDRVKSDLKRDLLTNLSIVNKDDFYENCEKEVEESDAEENDLPEVNEVSILAVSKRSIENKGGKKKNCLQRIPFKGFILASSSATLFGISAVFTKLSVALTATDVGFIRYTIQFIFAVLILKCKGFSLLGPKKQRKLLFFRAVIGSASLITFLFAFKLLDPSDCITLAHTSIIITSVLARIFLKEKFTFAHLIALVLAGGGVFLIAKPKSLFNTHITATMSNFSNSTNSTSSQEHTSNSSIQSAFYTSLGVLLALSCALCSSTVQVILKKLSAHKVHYSVVLIYVTYAGIPLTFIISLISVVSGLAHKDFTKNAHLLPTSILCACISGLLGTIGQLFMNLSLKYESASRVSIIRSLEVLIAFILQYVVLNIHVDFFSISGSCSIMLGTVLILSFKMLEDKMEEKNQAKRATQKNNSCTRCILFRF